MRWDELKIDAEEGTTLPGYRDPAVVRHFDAPEAMGTRFYEVRAKSALNRVPEASQMPFRWTINPYRGCSHACVYCLAGDTPILMADGTSRAIEHVRVGDRIFGTEREGEERRYVETAVLAHWETRKRAYRVLLDDGTELVASADHRFLTREGWKFVAREPALSTSDHLVGVGASAVHELSAPVRGRDDVLLLEREAVRPRVAGTAVGSPARLAVASIEPLGDEIAMYDITTGTGDFIANGVVSHNCFARPTHTYLDMNAGRDFEKEIVVKVNVPEILRAELRKPSWKREHVALGTNTDPYQWVEGRYKLMPGIWEAFRDFRNPCSVLTKSPLLLRDLPLMKEVAEVAPITANLSIPTIDEKAWRATEPHTPNPRARMEAVAELNRAGIPTGILVAPLMPGINDAPEQVDEILQLAADAGAVHIGGIGLHLRGEVRDIFMDWLRSQRPDLVPRYEALYSRGAYLPKREQERLSKMVGRSTVERRRYLRDRVNLGPRDQPSERPRSRPAKEVEQPSLF
jgi:DNA repair photolyase